MKNSKTRKKIIGFRYNVEGAIAENDKVWHGADLQQVILIETDSKNHKYLQFIYDENGKLLCSQINDEIYNGDKNLLVKTNDLQLEENDSVAKTFINLIKKTTGNTFAFATWLIKGDN